MRSNMQYAILVSRRFTRISNLNSRPSQACNQRRLPASAQLLFLSVHLQLGSPLQLLFLFVHLQLGSPLHTSQAVRSILGLQLVNLVLGRSWQSIASLVLSQFSASSSGKSEKILADLATYLYLHNSIVSFKLIARARTNYSYIVSWRVELPRFGPEPWFEPDRTSSRFILSRTVLPRS